MKPADGMPLHAFVSRAASTRIQISNISWQYRGISNFILEQVPFSFSTGTYFAAHISRMIQALNQQKKATHRPIHCMEWGAGLNILALHILDDLKKHAPKLYQKLQFHISDYSPSLIEELTKLNAAEKHAKKIQFHVEDMTCPKFKKKFKADVMYMTYLVDSLPGRHLEVEDGKIYEIQVKTSIPKNSKLIDTTVFPPKIITAPAIKTLLTKRQNDQRLSILAPKILPLLHETYRRIPIEKLPNMSRQEYQNICGYVSSLPKFEGHIRFNYSFLFYTAVKKLLTRLSENGVIIIYDYGFNQYYTNTPEKELIQCFGLTVTYPVHSPFIRYAARAAGAGCHHLSHGEGKDQIFLISKTNRHQKSFEKIFKTAHNRNEGRIINRIKKLSAKQVASDKKIIQRLLRHLPPSRRQSHYLNLALGIWLYDKNQSDLAKHHIKKSLKSYEKIGILNYYTLAFIAKQKGQLKKALYYLKKINRISKYYPYSYNESACIYGKQNDGRRYIKYAKEYLKYNPTNTIFEHLITMALINIKHNNPTQAKTLFNWLIKNHTAHPDIIPKPIRDKAQGLITQFKL